MKVVYDPETDTLTVVFRRASVSESDEVGPGVIVDYGQRGDVIAFEVLDASKRIRHPRDVTMHVRGESIRTRAKPTRAAKRSSRLRRR